MDKGSLRPAPSRRKSSNLLASLGRQNTLSDRDMDGLSSVSESVGSTYGPSTPVASSQSSMYSGMGSSSLLGPTAPTAQNTPSSQSSFGLALENLRYLLQKRMSTFTYLKNAHEGKVHWFNTILLQREELDAVFDNAKMSKRTVRFSVLGMSLSVLLEISAAHDFLRGLLSLLNEFDTVTDDNFRVKTKNLFKAGKNKRPSGTTDYPLNMHESGDLSYFFSPNIPFELDYFQVLYTLCDILSEVYSKIFTFLGPSGNSANAASFPGFAQPPGSLAGGQPYISSQSSFIGSDRRSAGLSPMLVEVVIKIDSKLKKIIALVTKELDGVARNAIKDELNFIGDSLLGSGRTDGLF